VPSREPPDRCPGTPIVERLPPSWPLYRVHSDHFLSTAFNPTPANNPYRGGRFDSVDGSYAYLYAGEDENVAIAETLLRELPSDGPARFVPFAKLKGKLLSHLRTTVELTLTNLHGSGLRQVGQDDGWLTSCDASEYAMTRWWAKAIRSWAPDTSGFVWRSFRDDDRLAYILFDDRTPPGALLPHWQVKLDRGEGLVAVRRAFAQYNAVLKR
jgi:hypothetical protein